MHRMLAEEPHSTKTPWGRTHIFWVDERCVPEKDRASNYGAAKRDFLDKVPIPAGHVHPMPLEASHEEGALIYQQKLMDFFQLEAGQFPIFDLIFLGIGKDGHTASLFPGQKALDETEKPVIAVKGGDPDVNRLTMTYPVLNRAKQIVFLVTGKGKAAVLKTIFEVAGAGLPARTVNPINGKLTWLIDRDAASMLPEEVLNEGS